MAKKRNTQNAQEETPIDSAKRNLVNTRYELGRTNELPYFTDFDRYYKLYESYVNENREIYQTKIFIPLIFSVVERYLPRLISSKPTVNFMPRRPDTVDKAQKMQSLFDWQWDQVSRLRDGGMYMELLRFVKEALIIGTSIAKVPWVVNTRTKKYWSDKQEVVMKEEKFFDGPDFQLIDPYDFFIDPEAVDIQRASWLIHRTRRTLDEMKAINASKGVEVYKNLNLLEEEKQGMSLASTEADYKYRRKTALGGAQLLVEDKTTLKHELMECWGLFPTLDSSGKPTENQEMEQRVITVADRKVIIRDVAYPYWHGKKPFVSYTPWPRSYEFFGIPILKHLERIQFYTNEFVNQKFDNQTMSLNQMIVVDPNANVEDWQLVWRPGGVIRAHPEYIKPLALGDVTPNIDQSLNYLSSVAQLTTGLSDYYTTGTNPQTTENKTATGANLIEEQISARIKEAVQVLEEQVIKEVGYQWHGLDGQFIKLPLIIRVLGPTGKPEFPLIMPEDIRFDYDVIPEQGSTEPINKALLRQQFIQAMQMVQSNPLMLQLTDWHAIEMELWKMFGQKQPEKLMTSTPGSQPNQIGQDQGQPQGAPQGNGMMMQTSQNAPQMMAQNMAGQMLNPQKQGPGAPTLTTQPQQQGINIKPKWEDLTSSEQQQVLEMLNIKPDMASRMEKMAEQNDQMKTDRAMAMMKQFQIPQPGTK